MPGINEYEGILKQFNFKEIKAWGENADRFFANAEQLTGWIDQPSLVPFRVCIEEQERQRFRDIVVKRMMDNRAKFPAFATA